MNFETGWYVVWGGGSGFMPDSVWVEKMKVETYFHGNMKVHCVENKNMF